MAETNPNPNETEEIDKNPNNINTTVSRNLKKGQVLQDETVSVGSQTMMGLSQDVNFGGDLSIADGHKPATSSQTKGTGATFKTNQKFTVYDSDSIKDDGILSGALATVSDQGKLTAVFSQNPADGNSFLLHVSKEYCDAFKTKHPELEWPTPVSEKDGFVSFEIDKIRLDQNLMIKDVSLKGVSAGFGISWSGLGVRVISGETKVAEKQTDHPYDIGITTKFVEMSASGKTDSVSMDMKDPILTQTLITISHVKREEEEKRRIAAGDTTPPKPLTHEIPIGDKGNKYVLHSIPIKVKSLSDPSKTETQYIHIREDHIDGKVTKSVFLHAQATNSASKTPQYYKINSAKLEFSEENGLSLMFEYQSSGSSVHTLISLSGESTQEEIDKLLDKNKSRKPKTGEASQLVKSMAANNSSIVELKNVLEEQFSSQTYDPTTGKTIKPVATIALSDGASIDVHAQSTDRNASGIKSYDGVGIMDSAEGSPDKEDPPPPPPPPQDPVEPEKPKTKSLWNGLKNRKVWIGLLALAVVLSTLVLNPIVGWIASVMLGVAVASDTEIFKDVLTWEIHKDHKGLSKQGKKHEKNLRKNNDLIRNCNILIDAKKAKIKEIEENKKLTPTQKAKQISVIQKEVDDLIETRSTLIKENKEHALAIAKEQNPNLKRLYQAGETAKKLHDSQEPVSQSLEEVFGMTPENFNLITKSQIDALLKDSAQQQTLLTNTQSYIVARIEYSNNDFEIRTLKAKTDLTPDETIKLEQLQARQQVLQSSALSPENKTEVANFLGVTDIDNINIDELDDKYKTLNQAETERLKSADKLGKTGLELIQEQESYLDQHSAELEELKTLSEKNPDELTPDEQERLKKLQEIHKRSPFAIFFSRADVDTIDAEIATEEAKEIERVEQYCKSHGKGAELGWEEYVLPDIQAEDYVVLDDSNEIFDQNEKLKQSMGKRNSSKFSSEGKGK